MDENVITTPDTPEDAAAEDAAFTAGFATDRGESTDEHVAPKADTGEEPVENVQPEPGVTPEPVVEPATPAESPKLFAGLTEDQIAAALARSGSMQTTVDKMAGRIGQLMQQIEALRASPPTTQQAQKALDLKLEKLSGAFPELANLLREDLQGLGAGSAPDELAPSAPAGITQEQFDAALATRLAATHAAMKEEMEVKVLSVVHPDWNDIIKTNEFALWRDNVLGPERGKELMYSEDSAFISKRLSEFKAWRTAKDTPIPPPAPKVQNTRLTNAVLPKGDKTPAQGALTEEDAFVAGFNKGRKTA